MAEIESRVDHNLPDCGFGTALLTQIIHDHTTLQTLVLIDADGQGTLCIEIEQLRVYRDKALPASPSSNITEVPVLNMKLRYAPC